MQARAVLLAPTFAEQAPIHDRDGSFPFENFEYLSKAGLLALTVPSALGGGGAGAAKAAQFSASSARPIRRPRLSCRCITSSTS
jgi:alkylation response protein AidB-like acyl-CoA dehydrogenase